MALSNEGSEQVDMSTSINCDEIAGSLVSWAYLPEDDHTFWRNVSRYYLTIISILLQ